MGSMGRHTRSHVGTKVVVVVTWHAMSPVSKKGQRHDGTLCWENKAHVFSRGEKKLNGE